MKARFFLAFVLCCALFARSESSQAGPQGELQQLSSARQWLDLLHVHATWFTVYPNSQIDSPDFFLSEQGKHDPHAELLATLQAFRESNQPVAADDDPRCRFPARYRWLHARLPEQVPAPPVCPELDAWMQQVAGEHLTLVFPAAYLNSPSSMFGHTLVRVQRGNGQSALLDWAVNYAANIDPEDNQLVFSVKGLAGGYPGVLSMVPYHQKITEYSRIEARDLWEYDLDLNAGEVSQFLYHVWELRAAESAYYFFTENCSYHLLTLIDAASERYALSGAFRWRAIPADTVRALQAAGAVTDTRYRPSDLTRLSWQHEQISPAQRDLAADLATLTPEKLPLAQVNLEALPDTEAAAVLEVAYAYNRYRVARLKDSAVHLPERGLWLLSQRARLEVPSTFPAVPVPAVRDDQGHDTWRSEITLGEFSERQFLDIGLRAAYHDLLDPIAGYPEGAQLEMFHLRLRQTLDAPRSARLHTLRFVDILTQTPRDRFVKPLSWGVSFGLDRLDTADPLAAYLHGGAGYTFAANGWRLSTLLRGDTRLASGLDKGFSVASGPRLQLWQQESHFSYSLHYEKLWDLEGAELEREEAAFTLALNPLFNQQLRFKAGWRQLRDREGFNPEISWHYYFY